MYNTALSWLDEGIYRWLEGRAALWCEDHVDFDSSRPEVASAALADLYATHAVPTQPMPGA